MGNSGGGQELIGRNVTERQSVQHDAVVMQAESSQPSRLADIDGCVLSGCVGEQMCPDCRREIRDLSATLMCPAR